MNEYEAWSYLRVIDKPFFRTGSREIVSPEIMGNDCDFVVLANKLFTFDGFTKTTKKRETYGEGRDFQTWRLGEINIIQVFDRVTFHKWKIATAAAKQMNIKEKAKRIALFQGVLYNNWSSYK